MDEQSFPKDEEMPYGQDNVPYYEYSSVKLPAQRVTPSSSQPVQSGPPTLPSSPLQTPVSPVLASPPQSRKNRGLVPGLGIVSMLLVIAVIIGALFPYFLSRPPTIVNTPIAQPTGQVVTQVTPTANFRVATCPFKLGNGIVEGQTVTCGYVTVPENRGRPTGAKVQLAVAIFKSQHVQNDSNPVIRLEGGPGGPSLDNWATYITATNYSSFVFNHDLIMFDQRGTGYSTPSLKCSEVLELQYAMLNKHFSAKASEQMQLQAIQACHDRLLGDGIDLNSFNTLENAADVHDLIVALGYKQANLYGVSYGTRLALTTMRLFPSVIRSVVLDSVYPPQENRTALPATTQRVFNTLFHGCAIDTHCNTFYPQLDSVFYQLVTDLNASPVQFQTTNPVTNKQYNVVMAGDDFVFVLFGALYVSSFIPELPKMIYQVRNKDYTLLSQIYGAVEFDDTFSDGMFYSADCSEDWDFLTQKDIAKALQGITPQIQSALQSDLQQEYDTCQVWNVQRVAGVQKQPVVSSIPTLVLSDEYDPITPPAMGKLAAQTLKNSYYFLFPGLGHGAEYDSSCPDSIISAFEDTPTQRPSDACIGAMTEPQFV